jgi:tRNA A37 threonylcarbamoyladenosine dehydratase
MASHERGYPALLDITKGGPVGALVLAKNAVAGDIWTKEGRFELEHTRIVGTYTYNLYPSSRRRPNRADIIYDRNTKLFGDLGQEILSDLKVGIIGLGGGGSLLNDWVSRLGVGKIIAVDFDRIDRTNLPRVVGATRWEAKTFLTKSGIPILQKLGKRFSRHKVRIARKVARTANAKIDYQAIIGNILDEPTAKLLKDVDFLFLATDNIQSRLVFNALVHQYLIPGIQIGIKIPKDNKTQKVGDITANTRPVFPQARAGCLECHDLIPASKLQEESLPEEQLKVQRYVDDDMVSEPSVITLNVLSAAQAANDLMMVFTGLYEEGIILEHQINFVRKRELNNVEPYSNPRCPDCSNASFSRRARGDRTRLPCRANIQ